MAIITNGVTTYEGATLREESHMWADGMLEVYAVVWDMAEHKEERVCIGYYGIDGQNLSGDIDVTYEISKEVARDILRTMKQNAVAAYVKAVINKKNAIEKGVRAEVIRGRKVRKGTILQVFWKGEKETYRSRQYSWMNETEEIAGCYDAEGNKVWIKTEYLKNIDPIPSPRATERNKFIKEYVERHTAKEIRRAASAD